MSKQLVTYERGKELLMRKNRILTIVCLIFCLLMLSSFACAKTPAVAIPTTSTWEERLVVYLDLISKQGYTVAKKEHTVNDYGTEFDDYFLSNPNIEEGSEFSVEMNTNQDEHRYISVSVSNDNFRAINRENIAYLMQTLAQVCDPSIANDEKAARLRVSETFREDQNLEDYIVNGIALRAGMYNNWIVFIATDPIDYSNIDSKSVPEVPTKPFSFTKDEWIGWFETVIQPFAVTLKEATAAEESAADIKDLVVKDQTEVYTLEHQLGISVGWILFDSTEQGLCRIRFVSKEEDVSSYLGGDIKKAVVRVCDPDFRLLPLDEKNDSYSDFCGDLWKTGETKDRNGISYETDLYGDVFTVRVS